MTYPQTSSGSGGAASGQRGTTPTRTPAPSSPGLSRQSSLLSIDLPVAQLSLNLPPPTTASQAPGDAFPGGIQQLSAVETLAAQPAPYKAAAAAANDLHGGLSDCGGCCPMCLNLCNSNPLFDNLRRMTSASGISSLPAEHVGAGRRSISAGGVGGPSAADRARLETTLVDFWVVLQQTQTNLQVRATTHALAACYWILALSTNACQFKCLRFFLFLCLIRTLL